MQSALKQELLEKIAATDDENLLLLLNEDYEYFCQRSEAIKMLDTLSPGKVTELTELVNEPFGHETNCYDDFR